MAGSLPAEPSSSNPRVTEVLPLGEWMTDENRQYERSAKNAQDG
jgi:hypothetical protein